MLLFSKVAKSGVWSLYFFEERDHSVTVASDQSVVILRTFQGPWETGYVVSTGWSHRAHSKKINRNFERHGSRTFDFLAW